MHNLQAFAFCYISPNCHITSSAARDTRKQNSIPVTVGIRKAAAIHLTPPVSFRIVRSVVEHGQCMRENSIVQTAVTHVQPLSTKSWCICVRLSISRMLPWAVYAMMIIGITISLAGNPSMNAMRITPSSPRSLANGSRKPQQCVSRLTPPASTLASSHMTSPAGAATTTARPRTNNVLSNIERTITFPICGRLYGGNSNVKEDGTPFSSVLDNTPETRNVINTPSTITAVSIIAARSVAPGPPSVPMKNIVISAINVGNLPLHGTKLFVSIAISRSLGESMIRQPTMPAALHPNPMHMVRVNLHLIEYFRIFHVNMKKQQY